MDISYEVVRYFLVFGCFFFQAEDGIRDLVRSRGLGDVYKRQVQNQHTRVELFNGHLAGHSHGIKDVEGEQRCGVDQVRQKQERDVQRQGEGIEGRDLVGCLLYTSDAADERSSVDFGGRRNIKKKQKKEQKKKTMT